MSNDQATFEAVLATLYFVPRPPPKGYTDKMASVTVGTPEAYFMLATYCFDLMRKLNYLVKIARPFAEHIPAELAAEILQHNEAINARDLTWEQRAKVAQDIMLGLYGEGGEEPELLLKKAAERVGREGKASPGAAR
jgi:hypothetical protein